MILILKKLGIKFRNDFNTKKTGDNMRTQLKFAQVDLHTRAFLHTGANLYV